MTLKVIGAGFGRTGTMSLKAALEKLGLGQCYHMVDVFQFPQHTNIWDRAADGQPVDWDALFDGYQSSTDWPGCTFYHELMQRYPDAKVVLTTREPEAWYESVNETIYKVIQTEMQQPQPWRALHNKLMWDGTFHGRFSDKAYTIERFNQHIQEVTNTVPADRLLVFSVKQGWQPLCQFLGVDVPDEAFPHLNDRESFEQIAARLNTESAHPVMS